jgi:hypothetical protein
MSQNKAAFGKQVFLTFKIWLGYLLLTKLALIFPHWKISSIALLNYDLFFLIVLFAVAVFLKARNNKYILLNLAIFAFGYISGLFTIFLGKDYSVGNDFLQYYVWGYRKIFISIITCITIIYIPIDYLFNEKKTISKYLLTLFITLPISFLYYRKFFLSESYLFIGENYYKLFSGHLGMNFLAIFFMMLYGYLLFYRDKPISGHVNLIVFCFAIFLAVDSLDNFLIYSRVLLPIFSQIFLFFNLVLFLIVLANYLWYLNSEFGKFYEDVRFSKYKIDIKLLPRRTLIEKYVFWLQQYFSFFPNRIFFIVFMLISISLFLYFYPYGYAKLNFIILIVILIILFSYLNSFIKRRAKIYFLNKK